MSVNKFVFQDDVKLNINGIEFSLDSTDLELIKKLDKFSKEAPKFADDLGKREDYVQAMEDGINFTLKAIDTFLGEGASEEIFKDVKVSFIKAVNVANHIIQEVNSSRTDTFSKYSPNRATRRSK